MDTHVQKKVPQEVSQRRESYLLRSGEDVSFAPRPDNAGCVGRLSIGNQSNLLIVTPEGFCERVDMPVERLDNSVQYLLLDNVDPNAFKGIRPGEEVVLGRDRPESRFSFGSAVSRNHCLIKLDPDTGQICVRDTSLNGTYVDFYSSSLPEHRPVDGMPGRGVMRLIGSAVGKIIDGRGRLDDKRSDIPQTFDRGVSIMSDTDINRHVRKMYSDERIRWLLQHDAFVPETGAIIGDFEFLFSNPEDGGRKKSVGYVFDSKTGRYKLRLFYKSQSGGSWRGCGGYDRRYGEGAISKGGNFGHQEEYGQYAQGTRLVRSLGMLLDTLPSPGRSISPGVRDAMRRVLDANSPDGDVDREIHAYVVKSDGDKASAYLSARGFRGGPKVARDELSQIRFPRKFEPDFTRGPVGRYKIKHTILGDCEVEIFEGSYQHKPIEWHMARDPLTDTIWVDTIRFKRSSITSFGTEAELILAGALSAKPTDYREQQRGMVEGVDYNNTPWSEYVNIKPTLDRMAPIIRYRAARQL